MKSSNRIVKALKSVAIALALPHEGEIPAVEAFCRSVTAWLRENPQ